MTRQWLPISEVCYGPGCENPPKPKIHSKGPYPRFCSYKCSKAYEQEKHRGSRYGMTGDEYRAMLVAQNHTCCICGSQESFGNGSENTFHIDHDHVTGKVRGLLCAMCNRMVGQARDNPDILRAGANYLELANASQ